LHPHRFGVRLEVAVDDRPALRNDKDWFVGSLPYLGGNGDLLARLADTRPVGKEKASAIFLEAVNGEIHAELLVLV